MPTTTDDSLTLARAAVGRAAFDDALGHLEATGTVDVPAGAEDDPEVLAVLAQARYGAGHLEGAIAAWERVHALQSGADEVEAGRAAVMVSLHLMMDTGLMTPARSWLARADHHLVGHPDAPVHAMLATIRMYERFLSGDLDAACLWSDRAVELGERHGVIAATTLGRTCRARVLIVRDGGLEEGLAQLDEVATVLMSGSVDPLTTGMVWCELICAVQGLARHDRVRDWTELMERWRHGNAFGGIHGRCRVHRAEVLRLRGDCVEAEREAEAACEELRPWMRREFGWPLAELGLARLRRGDLDGAHDALLASHQQAWDPHPGLAMVHLARGDVDAAHELIAAALEHPLDIPSKERPPNVALRRAPLLEAAVEIAVAARDVAMATACTDELAGIGDHFPGPGFVASVATAQARLALLQGDADHAVRLAEAAVQAWAAVGAPWEVATARLVLGCALRSSGRETRARLEFEAACTGFRSLHAEHWANVANACRDGTPSVGGPEPLATGAAVAGSGVFRLEGDTRTIGWGGISVLVRDLKGMRHLARLLEKPGDEHHVLALITSEEATATPDRGDAGPLLDDEARRTYLRRLDECDRDIAEAERDNDSARVDLARVDRDWILAELSRSVGLGGRARTTASTVERARVTVTRAIRYAVDRIREHHPGLADHLDASIRTGTWCCYEPGEPTTWAT